MTASPLTRLPILAAQWTYMVFALVANARRFSRMSQAGSRGAEARAEDFEMQVRCALVVLNRQVADVGDVQSTEDIRAMKTLHVAQTCLVMLAMVAANMRAKLRLHSDGAVRWIKRSAIHQLRELGNTRGGYPPDHVRGPSTLRRAGEIGPRGYNDSS